LARVRPGSYLAIVRSDGAEHFYLVRTEKDGAQLSGLLRVNKGETVGNVRIVIGRTLGVVRVRVAVRSGRVDLSLVEVVVEVVGSGAPLLGGYCDSSGTLQITGVPPGDIRVRAETPDFESKRYVRSKAVRIALPLDGTVDVTLELDPAANPTGEGDEQ
jgi:hypothetical protein